MAEPELGSRDFHLYIVKLQAVLPENQFRLKPLENIVELIAVHFHVDGADGRARGHHTEIAEQLLDRVIGEKRHTIVRTEIAIAQEGRELPDRTEQLSVADTSAVFGRDHPWLVWVGPGCALNPAAQQVRSGVVHIGIWLVQLLSNLSISRGNTTRPGCGPLGSLTRRQGSNPTSHTTRIPTANESVP
jgi:hypothetical protein